MSDRKGTFVVVFMLANSIVYGSNVLNAYFKPPGSAFFSDTGSSKESSIYFQNFIAAGNNDGVSLNVNIGNLRVNSSINLESGIYQTQPLITVHLFQSELRDDDPVLHFLCHSLSTTPSSVEVSQKYLSTCCIIKVTASNRHFFTGCLIDSWFSRNVSNCHASIQIENRAWNNSHNNELDISFRVNTVRLMRQHSMNILMESTVLSRQCLTPLATQMSDFRYLAKISLKKLQNDEIREIGRYVLLDIPARRLKNSEYFSVPVRVKKYSDIAEFTLRCEIPVNTYIEFVRIVWPWETDESTTGSENRDLDLRRLQLNNGFNMWDISQRHIPSMKGNVTEVVAQYRESATDGNLHDTFRDDPVIYKLLFRVATPLKGGSGRVGPRLLWSLMSLSRRNTVDQAASGSPIVTRLNVESAEFKYISLVVKSKTLINTAVLSGYPVSHPVWVFGLTHANKIKEVTRRATCHTDDDTIIHFPRDACSSGLLFSGGELSGSSTLSLVAKLDQTSTQEQLVIWFPQPHTISLVVDSPKDQDHSPIHEYSTASILLRGLADSQQDAIDRGHQQNSGDTISTHFQQTRLRIFVRFGTSLNEFSSGVIFGGQAVDVTELTAHRFRLEYANEGIPIQTFPDHQQTPQQLEVPARLVLISETHTNGEVSPARVWLVGRRPGRVRVKLAAVCDSPLVKTALPPSLERLRKKSSLKQQHSQDFGLMWEPQQTLWVTVNDGDVIWPVSITAQLVTGITLTVIPKEDVDGKPSSKLDQSSASDGRSDFLAYTAHIRFSGSRVGRSKPGFSQPSPTPLDSFDDSLIFSKFSRSRRVRRDQHSSTVTNTRPLPRQGLLVVTVQFSDGSVLPWHRIMEVVWELGLSSPPYKMVVENMRPDLVRVDMPLLPTPPFGDEKTRRKRETAKGHNWFVFSRDQPTNQTSDYSNFSQAELYTRPQWLGPTVMLLREDESFIGDLLKVNLYSNEGSRLLFSAPVHASIVAARPNRRTDTGFPLLSPPPASSPTRAILEGEPNAINPSPIIVSERSSSPYWSDFLSRKNANITEDQLDREDFKPLKSPMESSWHLSESSDKTNRLNNAPSVYRISESEYESKVVEFLGSPALKDAPGMRSAVNWKPEEFTSGHFADKAKKETQTLKAEHKISATEFSDEKIKQDSPQFSEVMAPQSKEIEGSVSVARPALELIMYILLGLFILIALIFVVNCGAMLARYRWEHARGVKEAYRLQHLSELAMNNANAREDGGEEEEMAGFTSSSAAGLDTLDSQKCTPKHFKFTEEVPSDSSMPPIKHGFFGTLDTIRRKMFRTSSPELVNRDNEWIWIGRDALEERREAISKRLASLDPVHDQQNPAKNMPQSSSVSSSTKAKGFLDSSINHRLASQEIDPRRLPPTGNDCVDFSPCLQLARPKQTCHYEGKECSIRILTNSMDPSKSRSSLSSSSSSPTSSSSSANHPLYNASKLQPKVIQHAIFDNQSLRVPEPCGDPLRKICCPPLQTLKSSPNEMSKRRSVCNPLLMWQSCHIETQQHSWMENSFHSSRCFCNPQNTSLRYHWLPEPNTPFPWVHRVGEESPLDKLAHGYQTLPTKMNIWHENRVGGADDADCAGSEYGTPPCPPVRTSSKRSSGFAYADCGNLEFQRQRPMSMYPQDPLTMNAAANELYSHLDCVDNPFHKPPQHIRSNRVSHSSCHRRAHSYTRIDSHGNQKAMQRHGSSHTRQRDYCLQEEPTNPRWSNQGPLEPQSFSSHFQRS